MKSPEMQENGYGSEVFLDNSYDKYYASILLEA
jgi:hypothetical protein